MPAYWLENKRHKQYVILFRRRPSLSGTVRSPPRFAGKQAPHYQSRIPMAMHDCPYSGMQLPPAEKAPSFMNFLPSCLCLGQDRNPVPEIKYNSFCKHINAENLPEYPFFRKKQPFFQHVQVCCTSFTRQATARKPESGPGSPGISISPQPVPAKMKPNRADSPRFSPSSANPPEDAVAFPHPAWYISLNQAEGDGQ